MADSGRSSKSSSSFGGSRRKKESGGGGEQLLAATPSDLLQDDMIPSSPTGEQYGSFYLRLGTVCKLIVNINIFKYNQCHS